MARDPCGGIKTARDVHKYDHPKGPTNIENPRAPGLHGEVYHGGTQGQKATRGGEHGAPGLGGTTKRHGTQR